jgi:steroid delta-isomerase-like uncharacterized protein
MSGTNKALVQLWCDEGFNKRNMSIADKVYDRDVFYFEPAAGEVRGLEALKEFVRSWLAAFPDAQLSIEEQVSEEDRVATRWIFSGTHEGKFRGVQPTGKPIKMRAMYFYRFAHDKVVEIWAMVDSLGLLRQLGVAPPVGWVDADSKNESSKISIPSDGIT